MQQSLGIGMLGLGAVGVSHARALRELSDQVRLVAFSGGNPERAAEAGWPEAQQVGHEELITTPGVDVVAICSPSELHAEHAIAALEAGKDVLVEKPIALTVADAERIVELARVRGRTVSAVAQRRLEPEYAAVHRLMQAGELGQLRLATTHVHWWRDDNYYAAAEWRTQMAAGGGSLMNQGVHNADLLTWLGGPVTEVTAQYGTLGHQMDAEDTTVATVRFASGALGLISTSTATPPGSDATVTLHFDRGTIELGQGEIIRWDIDTPQPDLSAGGGPASGAADPAAIGIAGHLAQWQDLVEAIRQGRAPVIDARAGADVVRLICAIYKAAETGQRVRPEELS